MKQQQDRNSNTENREERSKGNSELSSNAANEPTPIYLTPDSTLQTPEEDRRDKSINPEKDDFISVSNDDLHETNADRMAGSDRAGTSERKEE
ncbi:MAG: hypothetical protein ACTHMD_13705 [Flavisolibacter sp.]